MSQWPWFLVSILVVLLDQVSKYWAMIHLFPYDPVFVLPIFNMTLAYNTGAAFSMLSGAGHWRLYFFTGFGVLMSMCLIVWILRASTASFLQKTALSLILGGAVGNVIDRIHLGHVVDFIDLHYHHYHWPVFNLADVSICMGAVLLALDLWFYPKRV